MNICTINSGCTRKTFIAKYNKKNFCAHKVINSQDITTITFQLCIHTHMLVSAIYKRQIHCSSFGYMQLGNQ